MNMKNKQGNRFERAQHRVRQIKGFHNHLGVFVIVNSAFFLLKDSMTIALFGKEALGNPEIMNWIDWNAYVWGVFLAIHALVIYGNVPMFVKKWEKRQLEKYMQEEEKEKYE